jgi:hypothetical protein
MNRKTLAQLTDSIKLTNIYHLVQLKLTRNTETISRLTDLLSKYFLRKHIPSPNERI